MKASGKRVGPEQGGSAEPEFGCTSRPPILAELGMIPAPSMLDGRCKEQHPGPLQRGSSTPSLHASLAWCSPHAGQALLDLRPRTRVTLPQLALVTTVLHEESSQRSGLRQKVFLYAWVCSWPGFGCSEPSTGGPSCRRRAHVSSYSVCPSFQEQWTTQACPSNGGGWKLPDRQAEACTVS